jgi:hypothetical protein
MPPPTEIRVALELLEGPIKEGVTIVLPRPAPHGHEVGLNGPQDVDGAFIDNIIAFFSLPPPHQGEVSIFLILRGVLPVALDLSGYPLS